MLRQGTVYVVAPSGARRRAIAGALRAGADRPEVQALARLPAHLEHSHHAVVVMDLHDGVALELPPPTVRSLGLTVAELKANYLPPQLERSEQLLTLIRWCAYEFLTVEAHLSVARALEAVGIRDRSDFRRQMRRARAAWRDNLGPDDGELLADEDPSFG
jgi:hypothetical protein